MSDQYAEGMRRAAEIVASLKEMRNSELSAWDAGYVRACIQAEEEILAAIPASAPPFEFDRYVNGVLMAEGVTIERETTLEGAAKAAARIASRGANGEAPVLVFRQAIPGGAAMTPERLAAAGRTEKLARWAYTFTMAERWTTTRAPVAWDDLRPESRQFWLDEAARILAALEADLAQAEGLLNEAVEILTVAGKAYEELRTSFSQKDISLETAERWLLAERDAILARAAEREGGSHE